MELGDRKLYIGGSDIASIMGRSRWKSALTLWAEKTGRLEPDDLSNNEYVYWGNKHEDTVAEEFKKRTGLIIADGKLYTHPDYDYLVGHTDRTIVEYDNDGYDVVDGGIEVNAEDVAILECKTASRIAEWKEGEIPEEYIHQVMWYMGISGIHHSYIACLVNGNKFIIKELLFDEEFYNKQVKCAVKFWDMVQNNIMPQASSDDANTLLMLYPDSNHQTLTVQDEELDNSIAYLSEKEIEYKEIEKEIDTIKNEIKCMMGENELLITEKYTISWKSQVTKRADIDALKKDGIYDKYTKDSNSRVLRKTKRSV